MNLDTIKTRFGIVGHSTKINNALEIAIQVAPTEVTVLVQGENGTGKDVFSRIIHQYSKRKHKPFIAINCGAIPEGTMDSELFGHEKGSFTSAYETRKGYFEEVNGGTIFLDEIAEMPLATQSRLLRVLESGEFLRVGSSKIMKTDVRIVAATNKNLVEMIRRGKFREDLYFRLNTVSIFVPPLRERGDDVELLFRYFLSEFAEKYNRSPLIPDDGALNMLYQHRWPGNVRELRNFAEKLSVLIQDDYLREDQVADHLAISENYLPTVLPIQEGGDAYQNGVTTSRETELLFRMISNLKDEVSELKKIFYMGMQNREGIEKGQIYYDSPSGSSHLPILEEENYTKHPPIHHDSPPLLEESLSLERKEKEMIEKALGKYNNNRKKAAKELGISERTLYRKIKQYELS